MSGKKIIDGLKDAVAGNFAAVTIEGRRWVLDDHQKEFMINLRNEIVEQCAKAVEARIADEEVLTIVDDETIACAAAVPALKDE